MYTYIHSCCRLWQNSLGNTIASSIQHPLRIIFVLLLPRAPPPRGRSIKCAPKAPNQSNSMRSKITHPIRKYLLLHIHTRAYIKARESICKGLIRPLCNIIGPNCVHIYIYIHTYPATSVFYSFIKKKKKPNEIKFDYTF